MHPFRGRRRGLGRLLRRPTALLGFVFLCVLLMALFAAEFSGHDSRAINLTAALVPPGRHVGSRWYPLGTDHLGRDIAARLAAGARISLLIGVSTTVLRAFLGTALGYCAGYYGGRVDSLVMRFADVQLALPFLVVAIGVLAVVPASVPAIVLVLAATGWMTYGRTVRAIILSLRARPFVEAALAVGCTGRRLMSKHLLPHLYPQLLVLTSIDLARVILAEASLSYLGLGVPATIPSWGTMIADGQQYLTTAWWVATMPGLTISLTILSINMLGDYLRDIVDPTLRGR